MKPEAYLLAHPSICLPQWQEAIFTQPIQADSHVGFLLSEAILPRSRYIATNTVIGRSEHFTGVASGESSLASLLVIL